MSVKLSDMITSLRSELESAVQEGEGKEIRFRLEDVEIETQVTFECSGDGKLNFWVLEAGGQAKRGTVQTLRLKLKPAAKEGAQEAVLLRSPEGRTVES